jgi:hypothetical protein
MRAQPCDRIASCRSVRNGLACYYSVELLSPLSQTRIGFLVGIGGGISQPKWHQCPIRDVLLVRRKNSLEEWPGMIC